MSTSPLGVTPWTKLGRRLPVATTSNDTVRRIVQQMSSLQTSRTGIKALGGEEKPKTKKGFLATVFDPESSALFAPARAVSAGLADVLGLAQDTELADYNPLEAAFRSAKGEFAVTGGDIFRTEEGESIVSRALKLGGAFGWDVLTDPLSYVGGSGVFTRKGLMVATLGDDVVRRNLAGKLQTFALQSKSADETAAIMNRLASQSRELGVGKFSVDAAGTIVDATGKAVASEVRDGLAAKTLANTIADAFTKKGRAGIIPALASVVGDTGIAEKLFKSLDEEVIGGLFLKNPVTGRPLARIAGGSGKGNVITDAANRARFKLATGFGGKIGTRNLAGKYGPTYSAYKQGLLRAEPGQAAVGRTLFTDFTDYRRNVAKLKGDIRLRVAAVQAAQSTILRARNKLAEQEQTKFDDQLRWFFHNPSDVIEQADGVAEDAALAASQIREQFASLHQELLDAGVDVGTQKDFVPLMYSDEYLDYLAKFEPIAGKDNRGRYKGLLERRAHLEPVADEDLAGLVPAETAETLRARTPVEANKVANQIMFEGKPINIFETDPIKLLNRYGDWAARTIETERFVNAMKEAGVLVRLEGSERAVVNLYNARAAAEVLGTLAPEAESALREQARRLADDLARTVSDETIAAREAERVGLVNAAQTAYDDANAELVVNVANLRTLDATLAQLEPSVDKLRKLIMNPDIARRIRDVGKLQETVEMFARSVANAKSRLINARQNEIVSKQIGDSRKAAVAADKIDQFEEELASEFESLIDVRSSLQTVTDALDQNAELLATRQLDEFVEYGKLLQDKEVIAARIVAAKQARKAAKDNLDLVKRDIAMPRAATIRSATMAYVNLRRRYAFAVRKLRSMPPNMRTAEVKQAVKVAKAAANDAEETLRRLIADVSPRRTSVQTAGRNYFKEIIKLADSLTSTQLESIYALTDRKTVDRIMRLMYDPGATHEQRMSVMGDMFRIYSRLRDSVSKDQLDKIDAYQRALFDEPRSLYQKEGKKFTAKINRLRDDYQAALSRGDDAAAKKLLDEINRTEALTEAEGLSLIGGGKVKVPKTLEDTYAPLGVREVMERLYMLEKDPTEWERFIARIFDPLALIWKMSATVSRGPGYAFTNLIGGILNNWTGNVSVADHALAAKMLSVYNNAIKDALEADPNAPLFEVSQKAVAAIDRQLGSLKIGERSATEVFQDFLETGVWMTSQVMEQSVRLREAGYLTDPSLLSARYRAGYEFGEEATARSEKALQRTVNFLLTWPGQRFLSDLNQNIEMFVRLSAFNSGYRRFGSRTAAFENAMMLQFDYQDLSDFEHWVRRFVPFYTWIRNNIPLQLRASFLQQDRVRKLIVLNENIKDAFGADGDDSWLSEVLPEYLDVNGGFASVFKFGGNHLALYPRTPLANVDEMFSAGTLFGIPFPVPRQDRLPGMLGPIVSPLEYLTNTNFDTGQQFRSASDKAWQMTRSLVPYIGTIQRGINVGTLPLQAAGVDVRLPGALGVDPQRAMTDLFSLLVGAPYGATTLTEKTVYGGLIQKSMASASQLRAMAAAAGVDVEWLRKEIRRGTTVAQLQRKIARGEGSLAKAAEKLAKPDAKERKRQQQQAQEYARILSAFQGGQGTGF